MRLKEVQLLAYVPLQARLPTSKAHSLSNNQLQDVLQRLPWGVLRQGREENTKPLTHEKLKGEDQTQELGFHIKLILSSKSLCIRAVQVSSGYFMACANKTSPARAQRKRSGFITGAQIDTKVNRRESFLTLFFGLVNSTSRLNFLGYWVLEKSSRSSDYPVKQSWQMHTAQLGPHYMEWPFCDYGWLVYQCGHEKALRNQGVNRRCLSSSSGIQGP